MKVQKKSAVPVMAFLTFTLAALWPVQETNSFVVNDTPPTAALRVASFNIKQLGKTKMSRPEVVKNIVRIMHRYDVVFVMETRDSSLDYVRQLERELGDAEWNFTASDPIGRTSYKEQYIYWYRPSVVKLLGAQVFNDVNDVFEREPYMTQFQYWSQTAGAEVKVTFVGSHIKPDHAVQEIEALPNVIEAAQWEFPDSEGIVTLGDLNADCRYLEEGQRSAATLLNTPTKYTSFVADSADTTVSHNTDCAYDRLFLTSQGQAQVKVANVKVFDFEKEFGLDFWDAWNVSDHYPVEFTLA